MGKRRPMENAVAREHKRELRGLPGLNSRPAFPNDALNSKIELGLIQNTDLYGYMPDRHMGRGGANATAAGRSGRIRGAQKARARRGSASWPGCGGVCVLSLVPLGLFSAGRPRMKYRNTNSCGY